MAAARGISKCDVDLREAFYSSVASTDVLIKINRDHGHAPRRRRRGEGGGRPADLGRRARFGTEMVKE